MGFKRCPGSSTFARPKIELVICPDCGQDVEIWSDEATGTCTKCSRTITRTSTQSCIDWCKYARDCLGDEKYKNYQDMKFAVRKQALVNAATDRFGWDERQQAQAWKAVTEAEEALRNSPDSDPNIMMAEAVLHFACESDTAPQETRLETAKSVLENLNYPEGFVKQVLHGLGTHN